MQIGYARTSTLDQVAGLETQRRDLEAVGCEKIFSEQVSSVAECGQLAAALDYLRVGDVLTVTKLDRLARLVRDLLDIVDQIESKKAGLRILDTTTPTGKLMLQVLGAVAEFERSMMLERQREGIAKAKSQGKYKGRKPTARAKSGEVQEMLEAGVTPTEVARKLGVGRSSVYRIVAEKGLKAQRTYARS